jgi:hypothetical protein
MSMILISMSATDTVRRGEFHSQQMFQIQVTQQTFII